MVCPSRIHFRVAVFQKVRTLRLPVHVLHFRFLVGRLMRIEISLVSEQNRKHRFRFSRRFYLEQSFARRCHCSRRWGTRRWGRGTNPSTVVTGQKLSLLFVDPTSYEKGVGLYFCLSGLHRAHPTSPVDPQIPPVLTSPLFSLLRTAASCQASPTLVSVRRIMSAVVNVILV